MVLLAVKLTPEKVEAVLGFLAAGMNPNRAAAAAGVSRSSAYALDRRVSGGVPRGNWRLMPAAKEEEVRGLLAAGTGIRAAARQAGVSAAYAYVLAGTIGGVSIRPGAAGPPASYCPRYLSREERHEIARLRELDPPLPVRQVAARIGRSPSTVSRELRRNAAPRTGSYQPELAHVMARDRQARPKPSKLSQEPRLRAAVQGMLNRRYSPEQASGRLTVDYPGDPAMRISHETIYQSIYIYPRGELRRELRACLRTGRDRRRPRSGRGPEARGKIIGAVPIGQRPPEAEGRLVPGHHEGDLVMGSQASNSAVGTIVERTTGYLTLLHLPRGHTAERVADAVTDRMNALPAWFARTLTWDNGKEMARHARITQQTGIQVYFADPHAPWQRGTNENTNGLLREYLPKGSDLSVYDAGQLQAIEDELNDRPRKRLGYRTPREELAKLLTENQRVATTP
jgi:transposase, IS30 family